MKIKTILFVCASLLVIFFMTACKQGTSTKSGTATADTSDQKLAAVFNNYWEENLKLDPFEATFTGDNRYNDQLPNFAAQSYRDSMKTFYQSYLDTVKSIDRARLSDKNKINYDIFLYNMNARLKDLSFTTWMFPDDFSIFALMGSGNSFQPFKTIRDYNNWLARLKALPVLVDSAIGNARRGMAMGVVLPKALVVKDIPQMESMVVSDPVKSMFYKPVLHFPKDISPADSQRLTDSYKKIIITVVVVPTYKKLLVFLKNEYLPKARITAGLSAIPGGKEMYTFDVQQWTTTNETPEQIYQTGVDQVALITHEMDSVRNAIGFKGDLKALFHYMRTDKKFFPFTTAQQVLDSFESIHKIVNVHVKNLFGVFPKTPFEIRQVEKFRENTTGVAQYFRGSPDGSRPGIFYVPIPDATKFNANDMENTFLHEAIPGHHYQVSLQQEDTALPKFRRFGGYGAFTEGYAFYCESLGKELGVYTDPYQYLGALTWEMHRAIRLVADVSIHTKNMTREQAIQYMMDHEPISKDVATKEIERYMRTPGQALSYMIGRLKIIELRNKYMKELGPKFSIIAFHDKILSGGSMPLTVLQEEMDEWAKKLE
jgi:uncharacterized protein (DUF885 family)